MSKKEMIDIIFKEDLLFFMGQVVLFTAKTRYHNNGYDSLFAYINAYPCVWNAGYGLSASRLLKTGEIASSCAIIYSELEKSGLKMRLPTQDEIAWIKGALTHKDYYFEHSFNHEITLNMPIHPNYERPEKICMQYSDGNLIHFKPFELFPILIDTKEKMKMHHKLLNEYNTRVQKSKHDKS